MDLTSTESTHSNLLDPPFFKTLSISCTLSSISLWWGWVSMDLRNFLSYWSCRAWLPWFCLRLYSSCVMSAIKVWLTVSSFITSSSFKSPWMSEAVCSKQPSSWEVSLLSFRRILFNFCPDILERVWRLWTSLCGWFVTTSKGMLQLRQSVINCNSFECCPFSDIKSLTWS